MYIHKNISLQPFNTFGIDVTANEFASFSDIGSLTELIRYHKDQGPDHPLLLLGGGSNLLFTKNFDGLVLKNETKGIYLSKEDNHYYYVTAAAGEKWHDFVTFCLENRYNGLENLSLIPGTVGAAPVQNIGAYGMELKDVFERLTAYLIDTSETRTFTFEDCAFGYRESIFKKAMKGKTIILSVTLRLRKDAKPNVGYGAIQEELNAMGVGTASARSVSQAVINIRKRKLPDPTVVGNAGSFFKNPSVPTPVYLRLKEQWPKMVAYPNGPDSFKLAAGWLIEQTDWKGYRNGDAGCHSQQALVLVNHGAASGKEIVALAEAIQESVKTRFNVWLEPEVNIL